MTETGFGQRGNVRRMLICYICLLFVFGLNQQQPIAPLLENIPVQRSNCRARLPTRAEHRATIQGTRAAPHLFQYQVTRCVVPDFLPAVKIEVKTTCSSPAPIQCNRSETALGTIRRRVHQANNKARRKPFEIHCCDTALQRIGCRQAF